MEQSTEIFNQIISDQNLTLEEIDTSKEAKEAEEMYKDSFELKYILEKIQPEQVLHDNIQDDIEFRNDNEEKRNKEIKIMTIVTGLSVGALGFVVNPILGACTTVVGAGLGLLISNKNEIKEKIVLN